jgi:hypothetical protein
MCSLPVSCAKDGSGNPPAFSSGDYNEQPDPVAQLNVSFYGEVVQQGHAQKKIRHGYSRSGLTK